MALTRIVLIYSIVASALSVLIFTVLINNFNILDHTGCPKIFAIIYFVSYSINIISNNLMVGYRRYDLLLLSNILTFIVVLAGILLAYSFSSLNIFLDVYFLPPILSVPVVIFALVNLHTTSGNVDIRKCSQEFIKFSLFNWMAAVSASIIFSRFEIGILATYVPILELGIYTVGLSIANVIFFIPNQLSSALAPHISKHQELITMSNLYINYLKISAFIAIPIAINFSFISHDILKFVMGNKFSSGSQCVAILFFTGVFSTTTIPTGICNGLGQARLQAKINFFVGLIAILFYIIFIPKYGVIGAALVRFGSQFIIATWYHIYICKHLNVKFPTLDIVMLIVLSIASALITFLIIGNLEQWIGFGNAIILLPLSIAIFLILNYLLKVVYYEELIEVIDYSFINMLNKYLLPLKKTA